MFIIPTTRLCYVNVIMSVILAWGDVD